MRAVDPKTRVLLGVATSRARLDPEAARLPAAARHLELAATAIRSRAHPRPRRAVRRPRGLAHVPERGACLHRAAEEDRTAPGRRAEDELVERQALSAGLEDARARGLGELE